MIKTFLAIVDIISSSSKFIEVRTIRISLNEVLEESKESTIFFIEPNFK